MFSFSIFCFFIFLNFFVLFLSYFFLPLFNFLTYCLIPYKRSFYFSGFDLSSLIILRCHFTSVTKFDFHFHTYFIFNHTPMLLLFTYLCYSQPLLVRLSNVLFLLSIFLPLLYIFSLSFLAASHTRK